MAFHQGASSGPKGRSYEAHINLVPYIDMMTTIIAFLMLSIVWSQIESLEVTNAKTVLVDALEMEEQKYLPPVAIDVSPAEISVHFENRQIGSWKRSQGPWSPTILQNMLEPLLTLDPKPSQVQLFIKDEIPYGFIAQLVDVASGLGFQIVGLRSFVDLGPIAQGSQ